MALPVICPICGNAIVGADYRCAAVDYNTWRTIQVHPGECWQRRQELAADGVAVVQDAEAEAQAKA
jgi:hypothetical protein